MKAIQNEKSASLTVSCMRCFTHTPCCIGARVNPALEH